jgi:hypothetical protein
MKKFGIFLVISVMLVSMMFSGINTNLIAVNEVPEPGSRIVAVNEVPEPGSIMLAVNEVPEPGSIIVALELGAII